jgi:hypothetical protein
MNHVRRCERLNGAADDEVDDEAALSGLVSLLRWFCLAAATSFLSKDTSRCLGGDDATVSSLLCT